MSAISDMKIETPGEYLKRKGLDPYDQVSYWHEKFVRMSEIANEQAARINELEAIVNAKTIHRAKRGR